MPDKIRIAVIDDHPLLREGVIATLSNEEDIAVVAEGGTADEAIHIAETELPDIILLDVSMPGGGISAAESISSMCPVVKVVMLTVSEEEDNVGAALRAGARGYVLKGVSGLELTRAVRSIYEGGDYVSPGLAARLLNEPRSGDPHTRHLSGLGSHLTHREEQILALVSEGLSNKEIGAQLELSEKTVKHYMTNILQKLQVRNRVEAALLVQRQLLNSTRH